jgi:hypothetical protein
MASCHRLNHPSVSVPGSCSLSVSFLRDCFCFFCDALMSMHSHVVPEYSKLPFHGGTCLLCSLSCFPRSISCGGVCAVSVRGVWDCVLLRAARRPYRAHYLFVLVM